MSLRFCCPMPAIDIPKCVSFYISAIATSPSFRTAMVNRTHRFTPDLALLESASYSPKVVATPALRRPNSQGPEDDH